MRIAVTGRNGQVASALARLGARGLADIVLVGRPELDLAEPAGIAKALSAIAPDLIINAAAHTAVDKAESEPDLAMAINGVGAGAVASASAALGVPVIQLSTDYVFDGSKSEPYLETDATGPVSAYGRSKLAGEQAVAAANPRHVILRTAWVYSAGGANFVRTMLRLAETRDEVSVVADQRGCPTSADSIAATLLQVAANVIVRPDEASLFGLFHMSAQGEATWADFAEAIFEESAARGGRKARVKPITTSDYPTPARRPGNSRLDCSKLAAAHGVTLPHWREALRPVMDELVQRAV